MMNRTPNDDGGLTPEQLARLLKSLPMVRAPHDLEARLIERIRDTQSTGTTPGAATRYALVSRTRRRRSAAPSSGADVVRGSLLASLAALLFVIGLNNFTGDTARPATIAGSWTGTTLELPIDITNGSEHAVVGESRATFPERTNSPTPVWVHSTFDGFESPQQSSHGVELIHRDHASPSAPELTAPTAPDVAMPTVAAQRGGATAPTNEGAPVDRTASLHASVPMVDTVVALRLQTNTPRTMRAGHGVATGDGPVAPAASPTPQDSTSTPSDGTAARSLSPSDLLHTQSATGPSPDR